MPAHRPALLALAGGLAALALPSTASAASVVRGQACARSEDAFALATSGWAPGASLTIRVGREDAKVTADSAGAFSGSPLVAPELGRPRVRTVAVSVTDGASTATARARVVQRGVTVPDRAKPSEVVRYRAFGFPIHRRIYLHVRRAGTTKGSYRIGRPGGACGLTSRRLRYMPLRHWRNGLYTYWFTDSPRYRAAHRLYGYRVRISTPF